MNTTLAKRLIKNILGRTYFTFAELCCKCGCNKFYADEKFLKKLLKFRVLYDEPFNPRSVYRCINHPDYSNNHDGHAVDVPYNPEDSNQRFRIIYAAIMAGFTRIGIAYNYIHLDDNPKYNGTINEKVLFTYGKLSNN